MDEEDYASVGFMFDANRSRSSRSFEFRHDIIIRLKLIDEDPGHVQSGQYLWPAAECLSRHLIENWYHLKSASIIELGAGCGLAGLTASKLAGVSSVILTDYDPGSLQLLRDNVEVNNDNTSVASLIVEHLEWGSENLSAILKSCSVNLLIGSDLLYCKEIVRPLFNTVSSLLSYEPSSKFVLASSFDIGQDIEDEVAYACTSLRLYSEEKERLDKLNKEQCRVQYFRRCTGMLEAAEKIRCT